MTKRKIPFAKPIQVLFSISLILSENIQKSPEIGMNPRKFRYIPFDHFEFWTHDLKSVASVLPSYIHFLLVSLIT